MPEPGYAASEPQNIKNAELLPEVTHNLCDGNTVRISSRIFPQLPCVLSFYIWRTERAKRDMVTDMHGELEQEGRMNPEDSREQSSWKNFLALAGSGTLAGALACFMAAILTAVLASGRAWRADVPLLFTVVLLVASLLFGSRAGVIGTVLAALVFATYLFNPLGNLRVASDAARSNLGWMLMIGIAFSFLFAPAKPFLRRE
jgi:K+-sensing histidine kinase KdpD